MLQVWMLYFIVDVIALLVVVARVMFASKVKNRLLSEQLSQLSEAECVQRS